MKNLIFVDVEATGPCPGRGELTEFGAIHYPTRESFHGILYGSRPSVNPALSEVLGDKRDAVDVFMRFEEWLNTVCKGKRPIFVSDNPAFDFQWINYGFWHTLDRNPFGHSGRRISDFYAGLQRNFADSQNWKNYRRTPHDHNPVHDALGNYEAFETLLELFPPFSANDLSLGDTPQE